jgi:hypothetical protein
MESAEHLAQTIGLRNRGIQVLLWENKTDLVRALLVLKAALPDFPDEPTMLPTSLSALQMFSVGLSEAHESGSPDKRRILLVPQASIEAVGAWLNGWRHQLAMPPGCILAIRRADFVTLCRRAPDLMSFAQSDIHEATGLLPVIDEPTLNRMSDRLPDGWYKPLDRLPGNMPLPIDGEEWISRLRSYAG